MTYDVPSPRILGTESAAGSTRRGFIVRIYCSQLGSRVVQVLRMLLLPALRSI